MAQQSSSPEFSLFLLGAMLCALIIGILMIILATWRKFHPSEKVDVTKFNIKKTIYTGLGLISVAICAIAHILRHIMLAYPTGSEIKDTARTLLFVYLHTFAIVALGVGAILILIAIFYKIYRVVKSKKNVSRLKNMWLWGLWLWGVSYMIFTSLLLYARWQIQHSTQ